MRDGIVSTLVVLIPDRLPRKYAYQVLLLDKFRRAGAEVVFLQHPISDDPNDQLCCRSRARLLSMSARCSASDRETLEPRNEYPATLGGFLRDRPDGPTADRLTPSLPSMPLQVGRTR